MSRSVPVRRARTAWPVAAFAAFATFALSTVAALFATTSYAAEPPATPPPPAAFFSAPDLGEAVLSPDGRSLAVIARVQGRAGLFVYDLSDISKPAKPVAVFNDVDLSSPRWIDHRRLVFSAQEYDADQGVATTYPGLFAVDADGGRLRQLIMRWGQEARRMKDGGYMPLKPNYALLNVPEPVEGQETEWVTVGGRAWEDDVITVTPWQLNVVTAQTRRLKFSPPGDPVRWLFDRQGQPRVVITIKKLQLTSWWRASPDAPWTRLEAGTDHDLHFSPAFVDAQNVLYGWVHQGKNRERVLTRWDFEHQRPDKEPLVVTPGFDFDGRVESDERGLSAVRARTDAESTVWLDPAMAAFQARVDERFPGRVNQLSCRACGKPGMVALLRSYSDRDPGTFAIFQGDGKTVGEGRWTVLGPQRRDIEPATMASVALHRIAARDGRDLPVWLTTPRGVDASHPAPAVVLVHGGPWVRGNYWEWEPMAQFLASRGYLVIEPEFRGSAGYGMAHQRAGYKQWGQAMQDDVADALLWARKQGLASDRACIAGASYGGYATLMGLVRQPELYRCGVAWVGVSDLELLVKGSFWVHDDISDLGREISYPKMVGDPDKDAAMLAANSPVRLADRIKAPVLLAYGEDDLRVPLAHGNRMREALTANGNPPEWIVYPDEGHGWGSLAHRVDFAERVERFLAKSLKGPAAPAAAPAAAPTAP